jgi:hypothetical protein
MINAMNDCIKLYDPLKEFIMPARNTSLSLIILLLCLVFSNTSLAQNENAEDYRTWQSKNDRWRSELTCKIENSTFEELFKEYDRFIGIFTVNQRSSHRNVVYNDGVYFKFGFLNRKGESCDNGLFFFMKPFSKKYLPQPSFCISEDELNRIIISGKEFRFRGSYRDSQPEQDLLGELTLKVDVDDAGIVMSGTVRAYSNDSTLSGKEDAVEVSFDYNYTFSEAKFITE